MGKAEHRIASIYSGIGCNNCCSAHFCLDFGLVIYVKPIFLFLLIFCLGGSTFGQNHELSKADVTEDIEVAISALESCHPGLEIHLTDSQIQSIYSELRAGIKGPIPLNDFHKLILEGITKIKDGHTDLFEGTRYREAFAYQNQILPFKYQILDGMVYVSNSLNSELDIENFSEIRSINGIKIDEILNVLENMTPADGGNIGFKHAYNEKVFGRQFAKFYGSSESYELDLISPNGATQNITVKAVDDSIVHFEGDQGVPMELEINRSGNYAILTINSFQYQMIRRCGLDYHEFLKSSFKKLKKEQIGNLVIDLRENYGGDNILGLTLYNFLTTGSFKWMNPSESKLIGKNAVSEYSNFPEGNPPFVKTHEVELLDGATYTVFNGIDSRDEYDSDLMFKGPGARMEKMSQYKFTGSVFVLTSEMTFSAAAIFSAKMYDSKRATFIGEETGGAHTEFCGGGFYNVTLPNSKFVLQIPFMKRSVSLSSTDKIVGGTVPHFVVKPTVEALRIEADSALEKALELIAQRTDR